MGGFKGLSDEHKRLAEYLQARGYEDVYRDEVHFATYQKTWGNARLTVMIPFNKAEARGDLAIRVADKLDSYCIFSPDKNRVTKEGILQLEVEFARVAREFLAKVKKNAGQLELHKDLEALAAKPVPA